MKALQTFPQSELEALLAVQIIAQSSHTPGSKPGCTMFVKLWQFDLADRTQVRLDTNQMALLNVKERDGVKLMPLFKDAHEDVRLEQWAPGASRRRHPSPTERRALPNFHPSSGNCCRRLENWRHRCGGTSMSGRR